MVKNGAKLMKNDEKKNARNRQMRGKKKKRREGKGRKNAKPKGEPLVPLALAQRNDDLKRGEESQSARVPERRASDWASHWPEEEKRGKQGTEIKSLWPRAPLPRGEATT